MYALSLTVRSQRIYTSLRTLRRGYPLPALSLTAAPSRQYASRAPEDYSDTEHVNLAKRPAKGSGKLCFNRSVLLTGGTSGIGFAVAERLIREGAGRILIPTRDAERGRQTADRLKQSTGFDDAPVSFMTMDITKPSPALTQALSRMECDTFIASAGISQARILLRSSLELEESIINTNLLTTIHLARSFQRLYLQRFRSWPQGESDSTPPPSHCFVALSSLLAVKGGEGASAYAASKAGLIAFTRALALEARLNPQRPAPPFRANVVVPGYIDTPMLSAFEPQQLRQWEKKIPLGRLGRPEEVADAVVFLVTNEYANNTVLNLDGGLSAT